MFISLSLSHTHTHTEFTSCVKVDVAVLGFPSLTVTCPYRICGGKATQNFFLFFIKNTHKRHVMEKEPAKGIKTRQAGWSWS